MSCPGVGEQPAITRDERRIGETRRGDENPIGGIAVERSWKTRALHGDRRRERLESDTGRVEGLFQPDAAVVRSRSDRHAALNSPAGIARTITHLATVARVFLSVDRVIVS